MVEHIHKAPAKKVQKLNIAGNEISAVLDIKEPYAIAIEKFELLRKVCLAKLGVIRDNPSLHKPYKKMMDHYLRNSAFYIMDRQNFEECDKEEIDAYKHNYRIFLSIISRIVNLTETQKLSFLEKLKIEYEFAKKGSTGNPIAIMNSVLSSI